MNYARDSRIRDVSSASRLNAVICGSFRRDPGLLRSEFRELEGAGCTVLSPRDLDFIAEIDGFVFGQGDVGRSTAEIEQTHLRSMEEADFVWLHCPGGYVGTSATMELGFAQALGLRVFGKELPEDVTLADLVIECETPATAVASLRGNPADAPAHGLLALQSYYARAANERGWSDESAPLTLGLLREEIDELETAMRTDDGKSSTALELADVQLYLVHLANILGVDLSVSVREKEKINSERFGPSRTRLAA